MSNNDKPNVVIQMIICLAAYDNQSSVVTEDGKIKLVAAYYLLNQILRQINVPNERKFISRKAFELWNSITDEDINKYSYQAKVKVVKPNQYRVNLYKGASKTPFIYNYDLIAHKASFKYREVFHDEHIIPIDTIIRELRDNIPLDEDKVFKIINKISICRMLKEENFTIIDQKRRKNKTIQQIIADDYQETKGDPIEVLNLDGTKVFLNNRI